MADLMADLTCPAWVFVMLSDGGRPVEGVRMRCDKQAGHDGQHMTDDDSGISYYWADAWPI